MLGQSFAAAANLLRKSGVAPCRELVDRIRVLFPVGGDRYDPFLTDLHALGVSPHLRVPKPTDADRTQDFGAALDEVRRGNAPGLRPVLLEWLWLRDRQWTADYLHRWQVELPPDVSERPPANLVTAPLATDAINSDPVSEGDKPPPAVDKPGEASVVGGGSRRESDYDICLIYASADKPEVDPIASIMQRIGLDFYRLELNRTNIADAGRLIAKRSGRAFQTVTYLSRHFFKGVWPNPDAQAAILHLDPMHVFSVIASTAHDIVAANAPELLGMPTGYALQGPEKLTENISRAVSRVRIGPTGLFSYRERFQKIESGRIFLEQELQQSLQSRSTGYAVLVICDVDGMKNVNARFSDEVGDLVLVSLECLLFDALSGVEHKVGRCGDDTFYAVTYGNHKPERIAELLMQQIREYKWEDLSPELWVTCSMGFVACSSSEMSIDAAIRAAKGMLLARKNGGNSFVAGPSHLPHSGMNVSRATIRNYFS